MAATLSAYIKAARELLASKYASVRDLAPPHLRVPCHVYVVCCSDGVVVRYDAAGEEEPKVRYTDFDQALVLAAPNFSEQVIHVPDDIATYVPEHKGPALIQTVVNANGEAVEYARLYPVLYAPKALPPDFKMPPPSARPPCLASINQELQIELHGTVSSTNASPKAIPAVSDNFLAHGLVSLAVGWQAVRYTRA